MMAIEQGKSAEMGRSPCRNLAVSVELSPGVWRSCVYWQAKSLSRPAHFRSRRQRALRTNTPTIVLKVLRVIGICFDAGAEDFRQGTVYHWPHHARQRRGGTRLSPTTLIYQNNPTQ